jgi:SAM-dependent MidA family methyltransferase
MSDVRAIIAAEARKRGVIPFARFMELALYCPNFGYYERQGVSPGRAGDFYTSVSVGGVFGELLAFRFAGWLAGMRAEPLQLVEAGAHDGRLALDILRWFAAQRPELAERLEYWILEPSAIRRESQRTTLGEVAQRVRWFESWNAVPSGGVNGIIFSNELLDAMPAHRLGWDAVKREWFEWGVSLEGDAFVWKRMAESAELLGQAGVANLPGALLDVLPDGFTIEVSVAALTWWSRAAGALKSGKLLTFDYGLEADEFLTPQRKDGTLRAYHRHHQNGDLLGQPGEKDITAHVNFTAAREAGESGGLTTDAFQSQSQFLSQVLADIEADKGSAFGAWTLERTRQFQTLVHPEHLGSAFRVLVQSRSGS